jgi:hypothetical protein
MNYLDALNDNRMNGADFAATALARKSKAKPAKKGPRPRLGSKSPVVKAATLTRPKKRAKLTKSASASGKRKGGPKTPKTRKPMAKRKAKKSGRLSTAEIKSAGGIKEAWARRKAGKKSGARKRKSGGKNHGAKRDAARKPHKTGKRKSPKRVAAGKKAAATRKRKTAAKRASGRKSARKVASKRGKRKSGGKRKSAKRVAAGKKAAATRRRNKAAKAAGRKPAKRSKAKRSKAKRSKARKGHRASPRRRRRAARSASVRVSRRKGRRSTRATLKVGRKSRSFRIPRRARRVVALAALENPMNGSELFVGMVSGLFGFLGADALDRYLATHPLVDKNAKDAAGNELFADNPPTTGDYAGLYNATAICAPMDATRWAVGLAISGIPLITAHFVQAPHLRSGLQFFGFAAGVRIVGKALTDLVASTLTKNPIGQRLYDGEMRAMALKDAQGNSAAPALASLPTAGLGRPMLGQPGCAPCAQKAAQTGAAGVAYPSMPREVARPAATPTPALNPASPPPTAPPAIPSPAINGFTGANGVPHKAPNRYNWGASDE